MRVSIFGLGYVGCVSAACFARQGNSVIGVDVNPQKVALVGSGRSPIVEPGLEELLPDVVRSGRLRASVDGQSAVRSSDVIMVCVGTPSSANGNLSLEYVQSVCHEIGRGLAATDHYQVIVVRSTVLPGTVEEQVIPLLEEHSGLRAGSDFGVCMNPEFLREGTALEDYQHPSYTVIGELDRRSGDQVQQLYEAVDAPIVRTAIQTAEMLKYVSNAFHALKIAFANEIGNLCKSHGIDGQEVMALFCQDRRLNISAAYLKPGYAFGGSCLPKDLRALLYRAKQHDLDCSVLSAVLHGNQKQVQRGIQMVEMTGRKRVGVLGLSFKAGTDDVRESPVIPLVETLVGRGYEVGIFDEKVELQRLIGSNKFFLEQELPHIASLMRPSMEEVVAQAETIVIANSSEVFRQVPHLLRPDQVLIDLIGTAKSEAETRSEYEGICW